MPEEWSWLMGHMLVLLRYGRRFPPLVNVALVTQEMLRAFPDTEMFLLDLWPSYGPVILTRNPEAELLVSQKYNFPKPDNSEEAIKPIVGRLSLFSMNGSEWKTWRSRFNPGFSATSLMEHVPYIVDRVQVFCDKLRANAVRGLSPLMTLLHD
jgi:cytochrome P450